MLRRAGLITQGRKARWWPCRLTAAPLEDVADWVAHHPDLWEARFDRLGDYLRELRDEAMGEEGNDGW